MDQKLPKQQRIYKEDDINRLFRQGKAVLSYPLRAVVWDRCDGGAPRILVSVAKKRFKLAVDRVRFKRLIREAYRKQKPQHAWDIAFIAISDRLPDYAEVETAMTRLLKKTEQLLSCNQKTT